MIKINAPTFAYLRSVFDACDIDSSVPLILKIFEGDVALYVFSSGYMHLFTNSDFVGFYVHKS